MYMSCVSMPATKGTDPHNAWPQPFSSKIILFLTSVCLRASTQSKSLLRCLNHNEKEFGTIEIEAQKFTPIKTAWQANEKNWQEGIGRNRVTAATCHLS